MFKKTGDVKSLGIVTIKSDDDKAENTKKADIKSQNTDIKVEQK